MTFNPGMTQSSLTPERLIAGHFPLVTEEVTVASGNNLVAGTVLGRITGSGQVVPVDDAAADGSQNVYAVLSQDTDASAAATVAPAYLTGEFNEDALVFGGDDTPADHKDAARALSIFFKSSVSA